MNFLAKTCLLYTIPQSYPQMSFGQPLYYIWMKINTNEILRNKASELRKQGLSFTKISNGLNVPKSTLSYWFRHDLYSKEITETNRQRIIEQSTLRLKEYHKKRAGELESKYKDATQKASTEFEMNLDKPLFIAGICLYIGEGDKNKSTNLIRISNIDPAVLRIFIKFSRRYLLLGENSIKFWPLLYEDHNISSCCEWWSEQLGIKADNFYKPQVIKGREKRKKLLYGVGNIIIGNKLQKLKLLEWIRLLAIKLGNAGIV
jgi:hypothetical protein